MFYGLSHCSGDEQWLLRTSWIVNF
eukprot:COSAG02_NODE_42125_length_387_cov_1.232639_1_plen_24_part_01